MNPAVADMLSEGGTTAPLADFLEAWEADDNLWWRLAAGHHLNLFEAAIEKLDEATQANDEYEALLDRLSQILTETAAALKGEPGPLRMHDWSDLPEVARRLRERAGQL
jgi:hypothetical protein